MVNKAFLSLAAVVLFAVFGTGVLVGMQVGGLGDGASGADAPGTSQQTTGTPADAPATATADSTPAQPADNSGEDQTTEREQIPPREFNERNISMAIAESINDEREANGLERLSTTGTTAEDVRQMARSHSVAMAEAGLARHTIDDVASVDRYEEYSLYDTCKFKVKSYVETADDNDLEVIGRTYAGQEYPDNGTQQFNGNDTAVATTLTDDWLTNQRGRLLYENAERIGVGVTLTNTGTVYATVNIC